LASGGSGFATETDDSNRIVAPRLQSPVPAPGSSSLRWLAPSHWSGRDFPMAAVPAHAIGPAGRCSWGACGDGN
jgi:hypothetical protein